MMLHDPIAIPTFTVAELDEYEQSLIAQIIKYGGEIAKRHDFIEELADRIIIATCARRLAVAHAERQRRAGLGAPS